MKQESKFVGTSESGDKPDLIGVKIKEASHALGILNKKMVKCYKVGGLIRNAGFGLWASSAVGLLAAFGVAAATGGLVPIATAAVLVGTALTGMLTTGIGHLVAKSGRDEDLIIKPDELWKGDTRHSSQNYYKEVQKIKENYHLEVAGIKAPAGSLGNEVSAEKAAREERELRELVGFEDSKSAMRVSAVASKPDEVKPTEIKVAKPSQPSNAVKRPFKQPGSKL